MQFSKIYALSACMALLLGAAACTDEIEYDPTPEYKGDQVFFSNEMNTGLQIPVDAKEITVPVNRIGGNGDLTVGITGSVTDPDGADASAIFTIPSNVTFTGTNTVANIVVGVDFSKVTPNVDYTMSLAINEETLTPYADTKTTITLNYAPWSEWDLYSTTEYEGVMGSPFTGEPIGGRVMYRKSLLNDYEEQYMFPGPTYSNLAFEYVISVDKRNTVEYEEMDAYKVSMPVTGMLFENEGEEMMYADARTFSSQVACPLLNREPTEENIAYVMERFGLSDSYFVPKLGRFYMNLVPFTMAGSIWPSSTTILQLPGFKDYSITFTTEGNYVYEGVENMVVTATRSADLASYTYTVSKGALTETEIETEVEAIKADAEAVLYYDVTRTFLVPFNENGEFTIVAVGYDESGVAIYDTSFTFTAETVQADSPWKQIGTCDYTDCFVFDLYSDPSKPDEWIGGDTWTVDVEESKETPGLFRLVNPYRTWASLAGIPEQFVLEGNYYLVVNASDPKRVWIDQSPLGIFLNSEEGQIVAFSMAGNYLAAGKTVDFIDQQGVWGTFENGSITFPAQSLLSGLTGLGNFYYANNLEFFEINMSGTTASGAPAKVRKAGAIDAISLENSNKADIRIQHKTLTREQTRNVALRNYRRIL